MFCVLGVARFNAGEDAGGDEADGLAMVIYYLTELILTTGILNSIHDIVELELPLD